MKKFFYFIIAVISIELICRIFALGYTVKNSYTEDKRCNNFSGSILDYIREYLKISAKVKSFHERSVRVDDWLFDRHYYIPNLNMETPGFKSKRKEINSFGFRGKQVSLNKEKDTYRIICLGSSYSLAGEGRPFTYFLEQELNSGGRKRVYEVINAAIPGQNILGSFMLFSLNWRKLNPDMVIIDNVLDSIPLNAWPFYLENYRMNKRFFLRERFYPILFRSLKLEGMYEVGKILYDRFHARRDEPVKEGLDAYESILEALVLESKGMGSKVVLLSCGIRVGSLDALQNSGEEKEFLERRFFDFTARGAIRTIGEYNKIMARIAARNKVDFIDMSNAVPKESIYYQDVTHRSRKGNEVFAKELLNRLAESKGLE